jgi:hypothetical protein
MGSSSSRRYVMLFLAALQSLLKRDGAVNAAAAAYAG